MQSNRAGTYTVFVINSPTTFRRDGMSGHASRNRATAAAPRCESTGMSVPVPVGGALGVLEQPYLPRPWIGHPKCMTSIMSREMIPRTPRIPTDPNRPNPARILDDGRTPEPSCLACAGVISMLPFGVRGCRLRHWSSADDCYVNVGDSSDPDLFRTMK